MSKPAPTLQDALDHAKKTRWNHCRDGGKSIISQAYAAVWAVIDRRYEAVRVSEVGSLDIQAVTSQWYAEGLAPATIQKRLNCLSVLGVNVEGAKVKQPVALKWWLSPEEEERAMKWLSREPIVYHTLIIFIQWSTRTGLRTEESLRLQWDHFNADLTSVTVPGLKTSSSQATLPLSLGVTSLMRGHRDRCSWGVPFPVTYDRLQTNWKALRSAMGWTGNGVTLKALRRSAARYLHITKGMPLDMVRQYLRHEDISTTMGYLRLTGGINEAEMRKYL